MGQLAGPLVAVASNPAVQQAALNAGMTLLQHQLSRRRGGDDNEDSGFSVPSFTPFSLGQSGFSGLNSENLSGLLRQSPGLLLLRQLLSLR